MTDPFTTGGWPPATVRLLGDLLPAARVSVPLRYVAD